MRTFLHRMEVLCQAYLYPFKIFFINIVYLMYILIHKQFFPTTSARRNAFAFTLSNKACFIFYVICRKTDGTTDDGNKI